LEVEVERALSRFASAIFDQRKRHAHSTDAVEPGAVMAVKKMGTTQATLPDDRVHDNKGD
jgi:hypothetical protein